MTLPAPRRRLAFKQPEPTATQCTVTPLASVAALTATAATTATATAGASAAAPATVAATVAPCSVAPLPPVAALTAPLAPLTAPLAPLALLTSAVAPIIQRTAPDDVEALQGLHLCQLALAEAHHQLYVEDVPEFGPDEWYEKLHCGNLSEWLQRGVEILHAKVESEVVGYVSFWPPRKGELEPSVTINHIVVMEGYRGLGIGKQLMASLARYLDAHGVAGAHLRLVVASANTAALEWYSFLGFHEEGRLKEPLRLRGGGRSKANSIELLWIKMLGKPSGSAGKLPPRLDLQHPPVAHVAQVLPPAVPPPAARPRKRRREAAVAVTVQDQKELWQSVEGATDALHPLAQKHEFAEGQKDPWRPADDGAANMAAEGKLRHLPPQDSWQHC